MSIPTFITSRGRRDPVKINLSSDFDLTTLIQATGVELSEDVNTWRFFDETTEKELEATSLPDVDSTGVMRLHCHPCHRIGITVNFECDQVNLKLPPVVPLKVVLKQAVKKFDLDIDRFDEYLLTVVGSEESLPLHTPIGSVSGAEDCDIELDLVLEPKING